MEPIDLSPASPFSVLLELSHDALLVALGPAGGAFGGATRWMLPCLSPCCCWVRRLLMKLLILSCLVECSFISSCSFLTLLEYLFHPKKTALASLH